MPSQGIAVSGAGVDLSSRVVQSSAVAASPAAATETVVCTLTMSGNTSQGLGVQLFGWVALTVGTNGTAVTVKLRQTGTSGTTIATTGALTATAANLMAVSLQGLDTTGTLPGQVYVVTVTVTAGSAASTVSAAQLVALAI